MVQSLTLSSISVLIHWVSKSVFLPLCLHLLFKGVSWITSSIASLMDEGITILVPLPRNMAQYGADAVWDFLPCFWASSLDYSIVPVQLTCCALLEFCMHTLLQWLRFFQHIHLELFVVGAHYRECQRGLSLCQGDTLLWIRSHSLWGSIHLVLMALLVLV